MNNLHYIETLNYITLCVPQMQKIDNLLYTWIKNQRESGSLLLTKIVRQNDSSLYTDFKQKEGGQGCFISHNGWFYKLKKIF